MTTTVIVFQAALGAAEPNSSQFPSLPGQRSKGMLCIDL